MAPVSARVDRAAAPAAPDPQPWPRGGTVLLEDLDFVQKVAVLEFTVPRRTLDGRRVVVLDEIEGER